MSLRTLTVLLMWTLVGVFTTPVLAQDAPPNPRVLVETSEGDFEMELFKDKMPERRGFLMILSTSTRKVRRVVE